MGIDRKKSSEAHHVKMAPQPNVLDGDAENLRRATIAIALLQKRPDVKFRRVTRVEFHFQDTGDVVFRVHSAVDGSFTTVVMNRDIEDYALVPALSDAATVK